MTESRFWTEKSKAYVVRVMTKNNGLHQRRIEGTFKPEDILWIDICEAIPNKPFKSILFAEAKEGKKNTEAKFGIRRFSIRERLVQLVDAFETFIGGPFFNVVEPIHEGEKQWEAKTHWEIQPILWIMFVGDSLENAFRGYYRYCHFEDVE